MTAFPFKGFYPFSDDDALQDELISKCKPVDVCCLKDLSLKNNFSAIHLNCRSVLNKLDDINLLLNLCDSSPSVILLSETWLTPNSCFNLPFI
jgi:hypothetical protein